MAESRIERDSLGSMSVPGGALYAAQTARAVANFPISGWAMPADFIAAVARIKRAAAAVHKAAGRITPEMAQAIEQAAGEIIEGRHRGQFPVDVFQTGSGTQSNMNANEVISNRAIEIAGGVMGSKKPVHPNDDVNRGQSSNDVIPTAIGLSAAMAINERLIPALRGLSQALAAKAAAYDDLLKIGRTLLMDAVPMRLGQEFSGYAAQIDACVASLQAALPPLCEVALGGTAVGTGLNAPAGFAAAVCKILSAEAHLPIREAGNHFAAQSAPAAALAASGVLRSTALAMGRVASDIRLLASGPRCALAELRLPALQPGSSIMPGKVNPVICESVIQVACQVVGCDAAIAAGATGGVGSILQLNVAMPLIASNLLTAIDLLTNAAKAFAERCIAGIEADEPRCRQSLEQSLAMVTALVPRIGYDAAAAIAKEASASGKTVRQVCLEKNVLPPDELDKLLDPSTQAGS